MTETGEGWARLRWTAPTGSSAAGYRIRWSLSPGDHPVQADWNGYPAAFTFSTDDGWKDNLVYAEIFDRHDLGFTVFAISNRICWEDCLNEAELNDLHGRGHEIASHSVSHPPLTRNDAFTIRYVGGRSCCTLTIQDERLRTRVDGAADLDLDLTDPSLAYLDLLVDSIDVLCDYTCELDHYEAHVSYSESRYLTEVCGEEIAGAPYAALTDRGCDAEELHHQLADSKAFFEGVIDDTAYRCRTFAYPYFAHDQREMTALMEEGYLGARDGNLGFYPGGPPVDPSRLGGVSLYQVPLSWGRPKNDMDEDSTRAKVRDRIAAWKRDGEWANWFCHTLEELDSAHVAWIVEELVADGGVWIAPFGEVVEQIRPHHVTVENPIESGGRPGTAMSVVLRDLPPGALIHAVVVAYETGGAESPWSKEVAFRATADPQVSVFPGEAPCGAAPHIAVRPNPVNPGMTVHVHADRPERSRIRILNIRGEEIVELLDGFLPAGDLDLPWNGCDRCGRPVPSGLYFCRYCSPHQPPEVRRLVVIH